jgi:DNA-binding NarL/FixJ family response regulator
VVARQPFGVADAGLEDLEGVESVEVVRRPRGVDTALAGSRANVVLVDTEFTDGRGFDVMSDVVARDPTVAVLALTPDPPTDQAVALATRAGARGFVDVDAEPPEFEQALHAVHAGGLWFPAAESRALFSAMADDLDVTSDERRSRLFGIAVALVPLTAAIAAVLSLVWRRYVGRIGVRPVDLAVDPASRVIDTLSVVMLLFGILGPLLFVSSWLVLLRSSPVDHGAVAWLLDRPRAAWLVLASLLLAFGLVAAVGPDVFLVLVVGPVVVIAVVARVLGLGDELPEALRLRELDLGRAMVGGAVIVIAFFGLLIFESTVVGPDLRPDGAHGWLAPKLLGFKAQPMRAWNVNTGGAPRDVLYLGGNADLYVLVDPCNDDEIELVSVSAHRLVVIDEVTCDAPGEGAGGEGPDP